MRLAVSKGVRYVDVGPLPSADAGISATVAGMQAAIDHALYGPDALGVYVAARTAADMAFGGDAARGVYAFLRDGFRYLADPPGVELLRVPAGLLAERQRYGVALCDCDDRAILGCSLLAALRILGVLPDVSPVLITVGRRARASGGRFEHVFFGTIRDGAQLSAANVVPADPQEAVPYGQYGRGLYRVKFWRVSPSNPYA